MFGFLKREYPNRRALREEFESTIRSLKTADPMSQLAVGHAINMGNSLFRKSHGSVASFQALPNSERIAYINKLGEMQLKLGEGGDHHSSLGFGLFKMWIAAAAAMDEPLMHQFAAELSHFSKKGDLSALDGNAL